MGGGRGSRRQLIGAEKVQEGGAPSRWQPLCDNIRLRITLSAPRQEVAGLVRFAAEGIALEPVSMWVKNCSRAFAGRAYLEERYCVVRIGDQRQFPIREHRYPGLKTAPAYDLNTWQEALVVVTAHELRHLEQFQLHVRASEVDAERWALQRLEAFRNLGWDGIESPSGARRMAS